MIEMHDKTDNNQSRKSSNERRIIVRYPQRKTTLTDETPRNTSSIPRLPFSNFDDFNKEDLLIKINKRKVSRIRKELYLNDEELKLNEQVLKSIDNSIIY